MASSGKGHTTAYVVYNRAIYEILDQICKGADMYPYVKQLRSKHIGREA